MKDIRYDISSGYTSFEFDEAWIASSTDLVLKDQIIFDHWCMFCMASI